MKEIIEQLNDEEKESLRQIIKDVVANMEEIERIKEDNKILAGKVKDDYGIPTGIFTKLAKQKYEDFIGEKLAELSQLEEAFEELWR